MSRILVFFPYNPWPAWHGAHRRCVEMLLAMRDLGHEVSFASSVHVSNEGWPNGPDVLRREGLAARVFLHRHSTRQLLTWKLQRRLKYRLGQLGIVWGEETRTQWLGSWFRRVIDQAEPEILFMNYSVWDWLVPDDVRQSVKTVIETHDLVTVNHQMQAAIQAQLAPRGLPVSVRVADVPDALLRDDFFRTRAFPPDPEELRIFDRYEHTIAISESEAQIIRAQCPTTRTHYVPVTQRASDVRPSYEGPPLLPIGPNLFNVQGYLLFVRHVLPIVRRAIPEFRLRVTGTFASGVEMEPTDGVDFSGRVDDFPAVLAASSFVVCPVFGGTGQQVKIVEAMANRLPVVALRDAADRSPLQDGVSGLVADSPEAFAEQVIALWHDRVRCKVLGEAGHAYVAEHLGPEHVRQRLATFL